LEERRYGRVSDLEEAIGRQSQAVKGTAGSDPDLAGRLNNLGVILQSRFERTGRMEDLEESIRQAQQAVDITPQDHPNLAGRLNNLGIKLQRRFERTGRMKDLEESICLAQQVVDITPQDHSDLAMYLNNLGCKLAIRFERTGRMEDLEESICQAQQAVDITPQDHSDLAVYLNNLGSKLETRFERTGRMEDLKESIRQAQQVVDITPQDHPNLAMYLNNLGSKLQTRFERTGRMEDLKESICQAQQVVDITPQDHPDLAMYLSNMGNKLAIRFERTGRMEDLEESICQAQQAVDITPQDHSDLAMYLSNMGNKLETRFKRMGRMEDLKESICLAQQAVNITPQDHPNLAGRLNNLGIKLQRRFEKTGRMEDLKESIHRAQQAVDITPQDHPNLAGRLTNLGSKLETQFERTGRMEDLKESIHRAQQAVDITPQDHPNLAGMLNNLGSKLETRFERIGRIEDLEESIRLAQQVVDITPQDHPDLAMYLNNLGNKLQRRSEKTGRMEDLKESIHRAQQAVDITLQDHPDLAAMLNNLGSKLETRFERTGRIEDLEESIRLAQQVVDITPQDHPDLAMYLNNFGRRLCLSCQPGYTDQALESFQNSWNCLNGIPFPRVASALQAIQLLKQRSRWSEALTIARQAVHLLPLMNNRSLSREDQQDVASRFAGLAADACSLSLQAGDDAFEALELVELGRGVIMGLLIDDRSDISALEWSYPEKAAAYDRLRNEVNAPMHELENLNMQRSRMTRHGEVVKELNECIHSIRQLPGHQRFLLGPTLDELKGWASEGRIVVINVTDIRSDAIIVTSSGVNSLKLPKLTKTDATQWILEDLTTYKTREERGKKNKRYSQFLSCLWSSCVEAILQTIHNGTSATPHSLPRIWWIGVGIANYLPFHAAGDHSAKSTENTFHWAISSYTPTIKALAHARGRLSATARSRNGKAKLLIVTMPETPGEIDLPGVKREMSEIQLAVKSAFSYQSLIQPNAKTVLEQVVQYDLVHFAGHGVSDRIDPFNSGLILQEGKGAAKKMDKLTVRQILETNLKRARIAYLSACSTAEHWAVEMVDEVIHLASGFQVAGFSHVIASMWSTDDEVCVEMAGKVYKRLKDGYAVQANNGAVAAAVHDSIMEIRAVRRRYPLLWAPYVHLGA